MKLKGTLLTIGFTALALGASQAAVVILDFGNTGASAVYTDGGNSYNRLNALGTYNAVTAFDGSATTWNVVASSAGSGGNGSQGFVSSVTSANAIAPFTGLSNTALQDGFFINNNNTVTVAISGLDITKTYNLAAFGAENLDGPATPSNFTLTVGTTASTLTQVLDVDANLTTGAAANWSSVTPDAAGNITFTVNANGGTSGFRTELNAVRIESIPEPSSAALLGLGVLALAFRRRK